MPRAQLIYLEERILWEAPTEKELKANIQDSKVLQEKELNSVEALKKAGAVFLFGDVFDYSKRHVKKENLTCAKEIVADMKKEEE